MARVIISAGHTNSEPGTTVNGLREVDVSRQIAKTAVTHIRNSGVLTLTAPFEMNLTDKIDWINKTGYSSDHNDLAVEIHINEADGNKSGIEGWFEAQGNNNSKKLTDTILASIAESTGLKNNGSQSEEQHELKSLAFVSKTKPIASLLEIGYLDNPQDAEFLKNSQNIEKIAKSVAKGILKYLNIEFKDLHVPQQNTSQPTQSTISANNSLAPRPSTSLSNYASPSPAITTPSPSLPFNNNPLGGGNSFNSGAGGFGGTSSGGGNSFMKTREERREMIKNAYIKILGREPNQSDLNYFLNTGITEDQLLKKMVDSQEHVDLVKARQEVLMTKAKFHSQQAELIMLRAQNQDKEQLINNLNRLLHQKNISLSEMQRQINILQQQTFRSNSSKTPPKPLNEYKEPMIDRIFRFFSDRLG